jgi:Helix-turn-helix domain
MSAFGMMNALMAPGLTPNASRVYAYLVFRANGARVCWPRVDEIAADLHMSERNVMVATKALKAAGFIAMTKRYKDTNNYHIPDTPGLHDRPEFTRKAPSLDSADVDLTKTAAEPESDLTKTAVMGSNGAEIANLGCQKQHSDLTKTAPESVQQESIKKGTLLRNAAPSAPAIPPDIRRELFGEGLAIVRALTGKPDGASRALLGRFCKQASDDCARVLDVLRRAADHRPVDPVSFVFGALNPKPRVSAFDQMHTELGTRSLWLDDEDDPAPLIEQPSLRMIAGGVR